MGAAHHGEEVISDACRRGTREAGRSTHYHVDQLPRHHHHLGDILAGGVLLNAARGEREFLHLLIGDLVGRAVGIDFRDLPSTGRSERSDVRGRRIGDHARWVWVPAIAGK